MEMDVASVIGSIISTGPLAAVLCLMWWFERKDKLANARKADAISIKHETYLRENADRLLAFADEQRKSMSAHDQRIDDLVNASRTNRRKS